MGWQPTGRLEQDGSGQDDRVLVARVQAGDELALGTVYRRYGGMVHGLVRRVTRDEQVARDVTQEVFTRIWQEADRIDLDRGSLRGYLAVMAHRRAVDEVRRHQRRGRAEDRANRSATGFAAGHEEGLADDAARAWYGKRLTEVLERLPEEQRIAITLAYFEGNTYQQVARTLGIPEGTAKSRLRLGLARLRTLLDDDALRTSL